LAALDPALGHGRHLHLVRHTEIDAAIGPGHRPVHRQQPVHFISWLSVFGLRGEAYFLGVAELGIAALLVAGAFSPLLSAVGSLMGVITFAITWSFFFTTPGVVKWSWSTDPIAWNLTGEFIYKDIVLFCVCLVLLLASLPQSAIKLRKA
jgi:uncharacterized membrane protein YkgB